MAPFIISLYSQYVPIPPASHFSFRLSLFIAFLSLHLQSQIPTHKNSGQKPQEGELYLHGGESGIVQCVIVCFMTETIYQLYAWTEENEVCFSPLAAWEQGEWYEDDAYVHEGEKTWADYERLAHMIHERGMFLLSRQDYHAAYHVFEDGAQFCMEAKRMLKVPSDGGLHPFLIAFDEMYEGCQIAALEEDYSLEEVFIESALQDWRSELWKNAPVGLREEEDFFSPSWEEIDRMVEDYRILFSDSAAEKLHDKSVYDIIRSMLGLVPSSLLHSLLDTLDEHDLHQISKCVGGMKVSGMAFSILEERAKGHPKTIGS